TPLARTIASTTVITGEELRQRGVYFLSDALKQVPGAAVVSQGSYGGVTSLFLRGGESDYTKVLIDGVPVNQAGGAFNFGLLSTDNIERIEIVRGPVSVLYGSDAVTGVIQVFTRRGEGPLRSEFTGQAGSHGTYDGSVAIRGGTEDLSYSASISRFTSDGIYAFNSSFGNTVGSAALTARPDAKTSVTLTARTGDNTFRFPTDFTGAISDSNQLTRQNSQTLGLDFARRFSERAEVRVQLASHNQVDGAENNPDSPGDTDFFSQSQGRSQRRSADLRGIFQPSSLARITIGSQFEIEDIREFSTAGDPFAATRNNVGLYGQGVFTPGTAAVINVGVRVEDNEEFGTHLTYRLGAVYAIGGGLRARGSLGSSFKEPSLRENFARDAFEVGNPKLDPEQSRSWEVGVEQALLGGRVSLAVSYFDQRFTDLIQYLNAAPGEPNYQNVSKATSRGVELIGDIRPTSWFAVTASYTYLRTNVDDAGGAGGPGTAFEESRPLVRRPKHSARIDARSRFADRLSIGVAANYVGTRDDIDFIAFPSVRTELPSYVSLDADVSFDLMHQAGGRPGLSASLRAENLFDQQYDTVFGFEGRGRAVFAGFRLGL
ncbi:MAG TPA: TonB-dependent receptor, partial [Gemmatimonadales bacterium]|nr:TonB-dependent receptor [Gemmatimonadales bacterium]